jgi:small subunit ribosomal protein S1
MPSPENAPPTEGAAPTDTLASPVNPLATTSAELSPDVARSALPPETSEAFATPVDEASVAPGPEGATPSAPRKRRRRRRRKGSQSAPVASGVAPAAVVEEVAAEAQADGGADAPGDSGDVRITPGKASPPREGKGKSRAPKRERPDKLREKREPRERPAFGVGDVVFGKILEITDEAILVDLSGKAKGIFDRAEMLLPDDPADAPEAREPRVPDGTAEASHRRETDASSAASHEAAPAAEEASPSPASPSPEDGHVPDETEVDVPPTVTSGGVDRKLPARRIIVAPAALAIDAQQEVPEPGASASPAEAPAEGMPDVAVDPSSPPSTRDLDAEMPAPKPAPYAPPIVLELGAHFVGLVHNDGARGGLVVLTRHPRRAGHTKPRVHTAFKERKPTRGLVTGVVKGGVEVDIDGLRAFAPGSHMDLRLGTDLHPLIGKRFDFLVTQYGKRGRDVVLSRKPMLEDEARLHRGAALAKLAVGSVVEGVVKSVVSFGAFVDLGEVEGLVALTEMSHNRAEAPADVFKVGETVQVKILRIDDKGKVWLSRKATSSDPRLEAVKKYAVGTRHSAKVVRLQPFGAFLELEAGIDGLIHTQDLSIKRIEHPSEVIKVGDAIDVVVASIDPVAQKISLHPALTGAAAEEGAQRVQINKPLKVVVAAVESGGLVVRVLGATGRNARGFITSAATGTPRGTELRKPFPVGTQLEAKVVEIDPRRGELKLSIKALHEETERTAYQQYRQQVTREAKFGTFGDLLAKKGLTNK